MDNVMLWKLNHSFSGDKVRQEDPALAVCVFAQESGLSHSLLLSMGRVNTRKTSTITGDSGIYTAWTRAQVVMRLPLSQINMDQGQDIETILVTKTIGGLRFFYYCSFL